MYSEGHTCEVLEAELAQSKMAVSAVVKEDGEGIAVLVEPCTTDDAQVLKRQIIKLIQSHQHITRHLPDGLEKKMREKKRHISMFTHNACFWSFYKRKSTFFLTNMKMFINRLGQWRFHCLSVGKNQ